MKPFAIAFAMLCMVGLMAEETKAQHFHHGRSFNRGFPAASGFSLSIGNGFNGFSYSNFRGGVSPYRGFAPVYRPPVYRAPVYGGYGYGRPIYGSSFSAGFGGGFGRPGCARW